MRWRTNCMRRLRGGIMLVSLSLRFFPPLFYLVWLIACDLARNPLDKGYKIDLHGLRPREAFVRAERALVKAIKEGRKELYLIVGQGRHSINGKPVLKETVQKEIKRFGSLLSCTIIYWWWTVKKWIQVRSWHQEPGSIGGGFTSTRASILSDSCPNFYIFLFHLVIPSSFI